MIRTLIKRIRKIWNKLAGLSGKCFWGKGVCLGLAAIALTAGVTVGKAMAYFTTYVEADGSAQVSLDFPNVEVEEKVSDMTKSITLKNTGEYDCYMRVKVLAGEAYQDLLTCNGANWEKNETDGYYYYGVIVPAGETAKDVLNAVIGKKDETGTITDGIAFQAAKDGLKEFNVVVAAECTPVFYDGQGNPQYSWEAAEPILSEGGE